MEIIEADENIMANECRGISIVTVLPISSTMLRGKLRTKLDHLIRLRDEYVTPRRKRLLKRSIGTVRGMIQQWYN